MGGIMSEQDDRDAELEQAFFDPKSAKNNSGEYTGRSADELIALDNHLAGGSVGKKGGSKSQFNGIKMQRVSFPPTV